MEPKCPRRIARVSPMSACRGCSFAFSAVELRGGRWAALEIKLGEAKVPDGIRNIERLREKVASNPAARNPKPEFCAVVTATSPFCRYDAAHDVYVFPISALRP